MAAADPHFNASASLSESENGSLSVSAAADDPLLNPPTSGAEVEEEEYEFDFPPSLLSPSPLLQVPPRRSAGIAVAEPEFTHIEVSDPQKEHDPAASGITTSSTFVSYLVVSRSPVGGEWRVRRRFRDVVALADQLSVTYRGFFVPVRPDKSVVEGQVMQQVEFVEQRRAAIEKYLRRLAAHPVIGRGEELRGFLKGAKMSTSATAMASSVMDGRGATPKGGRDLFGMFKDIRQTVASGWAAVVPPAVEVEDKDFLATKAKLQDLEQQLTTTSQQAESLVKAQQDVAEAMAELGMTFIKFGKFETAEVICSSQKTRAIEIRSFATAAVKASRLHRGLNGQIVHQLDTLHEYLGVMLSVHSAFADRANALAAIQTLSADLYSLHSRAEKLGGSSSRIFQDSSKTHKFEELKETIELTEEAKRGALKAYDRIKENNKTELDRFHKERRDDFLAMLRGFVVNQVDYSEKISNVWAVLSEETKLYARHTN